jgi:PIN domain nuclease of toxin-antitoxin system
MICLLDSHALLWFLLDDKRLSPRVRALILDRHTDVYASTVSFWEISLKKGIGKLPLTGIPLEDYEEYLFDQYIGIIGLNEQESLSFYHLPQVEGHRDPFDRMLAWQAIKRGMALISSDAVFEQYRAFGLRLVW